MGWVVVAFAVLAVGWVLAFNRLRAQDVAVEAALSGVDIELTRRADLLPALTRSVSSMTDHERQVMEEVTAARSAVQRAVAGSSIASRASAEQGLSAALREVTVVAEAYPALTSSSVHAALMEQVADTETRLAQAREEYNRRVAAVNTSATQLPWKLVAGAAGVFPREFFEAPSPRD